MDIFGREKRAIDRILEEAEFPERCRKCLFPRMVARSIIKQEQGREKFRKFTAGQDKHSPIESLADPMVLQQAYDEIERSQMGYSLRYHNVLVLLGASAAESCPGLEHGGRRRTNCQNPEVSRIMRIGFAEPGSEQDF